MAVPAFFKITQILFLLLLTILVYLDCPWHVAPVAALKTLLVPAIVVSIDKNIATTSRTALEVPLNHIYHPL